MHLRRRHVFAERAPGTCCVYAWLLAARGELQQLGRVDEAVVAVGADVEP
jgi:hypothetical protein